MNCFSEVSLNTRLTVSVVFLFQITGDIVKGLLDLFFSLVEITIYCCFLLKLSVNSLSKHDVWLWLTVKLRKLWHAAVHARVTAAVINKVVSRSNALCLILSVLQNK